MKTIQFLVRHRGLISQGFIFLLSVFLACAAEGIGDLICSII